MKNPPPHDAPEGPVSLHPLRCLPAASAPCGASHLAREGRLAWARNTPCLDAGAKYTRDSAAAKVGIVRNGRMLRADPASGLQTEQRLQQHVSRHEDERDERDEQQQHVTHR